MQAEQTSWRLKNFQAPYEAETNEDNNVFVMFRFLRRFLCARFCFVQRLKSFFKLCLRKDFYAANMDLLYHKISLISLRILTFIEVRKEIKNEMWLERDGEGGK